ncbi:MAG: spore cortex-lytic enzyme [Oscillospiraceae bacterium]|nr:spore cortex-lytic enzyme [Oscillospiraceae bacterium]
MKGKKQIKIFLALVMVAVLIVGSVSIASQNFYGNGEVISTLSRLGSRGEEVRQVQKKLKELGYYNGAVDGIFGSGTQKAVRAFQKNCGLTVDGIAGPKTLQYLGLTSGSSSASLGKYSQSDINLLAKLIAAEARGESYTGQVAVGAVVLNRVGHSSFPDSIAGVIYQRGAFSCVNDSNWSVYPNSTSLKAARDCINGWDPSGGAIYYYNPAKTSNAFMLSRPVITTIGSHVFCR